MKLARFLLLASIAGVAACGPATRAPGSAERPAQGAEPQGQVGPPRTLTIAAKYEPVNLAPKASATLGVNSTLRLFSAQLTYIDGKGLNHAYLAESIPQLNSDTWRVQPDGRMEVVYTLRKGLTWQDGKPLTADDFVFAYRAYTTPGIGVFTPTPQNLIEDVVARDPLTFTMRWRGLYPDAANLRPSSSSFDPLPRHILEAPLNRFNQDPVGQQEVFRNLPYWTQEYVGAGPFQLERWDPGSQLEGVAFAGHILGRPKIDRVIVRIVADENTGLSNLLSENIHVAGDFALRFEHATVLLANWETSKRGVVVLDKGSFNHTIVQLRPEFQLTPALLDVRVRRALAHTIDRQTLNDVLFDGKGFMIETNVPTDARFYPQVERSIARYPYDPRRAEQLMVEAGLVKDSGGFFASAQGERFRPDFYVIQGPLYERQQALMQDTWARAGIDMSPRTMGAAQLRDFEAAVTFSGLSNRGLGSDETTRVGMFTSAQIGAPANRWVGNNRGGWPSPEYDKIFDAFGTTLDRSERDRQLGEMMKLATEHLPMFPMYFNVEVLAHLATVRGPAVGDLERLNFWNVHEWEMG